MKVTRELICGDRCRQPLCAYETISPTMKAAFAQFGVFRESRSIWAGGRMEGEREKDIVPTLLPSPMPESQLR